ncbi:phage/plasmid primase, P4 family [Nesterenkonia jeotgali]|nr:phage/plasmid primase, P4 family [Nesterenkonia jeotgali]
MIDGILGRLDRVSAPQVDTDSTSWKACCPVHDDSNPSLSITEKADGTVLAHCFAGCDQQDVRSALGLPSPSTNTGSGVWMPGGIQHEETYVYTDADGKPLFEVLRGRLKGKKEIRQRVPDSSKRYGYSWSLKDLDRDKRKTLYMRPVVDTAIDEGERILVVEGEKDVHTALALGEVATCNAGGAGGFELRHSQQLEGAHVNIIQDKDDPGRKHGSLVYRLLEVYAASARLFDVHPSLPEKADLTDHVEAGFGLDDLVEVEPDASVGRPSGDSSDNSVVQTVSEWTDSGVSERLAQAVGDRWRWVAGVGWYRWTGKVWQRQEDDTTFAEAVRKFASSEIQRVLSSGGVVGEAARLLSKSKITAVSALAKGQLHASLLDFDTDPDIFVANNCVVDLRTGEQMPHDPSRLVTKCSSVNYRPDATHPDWVTALGAADPCDADWLQIRFGQSMTGHVPDDDVMPVLKGGGENGKSTILGVVLEVAGDYAMLVPSELLLGNPNDHPTKKMVLKGLRLGVKEETTEGRRLNMTGIKEVMGTPMITGHYMRQDDITFRATHALVVSTNPELTVDEDDDGTWRRLAKVEFPYRYRKPGEALELPKDRRGDPLLRDRLRSGQEQQEAVLAWLVEGARRWYEDGRHMPPQPPKVAAATETWRRKSDHWRAFAEDHLVLDGASAVWIEDLHKEMNTFLMGRGHQRWGSNLFRGRLEENSWLQQPGVFLSGRERLSTLGKRLGNPVTLDRPLTADPIKSPPVQGQYVVGVRFRAPEDDLDTGSPAPAAKQMPAERDRPMPVIADVDEES